MTPMCDILPLAKAPLAHCVRKPNKTQQLLAKLELRDFKCAWFDENSYYEFFPLHTAYKKKVRNT